MLRLSSLTIHKFRNVAPNTTLRFAGGMNLVLGQNGTGKTTLLELIVCAVNLNFDRYDTEELEIGFEFEDANLQASAKFRFSHALAKPQYAELALDRETLVRTIESTWTWDAGSFQLISNNNKLLFIPQVPTETEPQSFRDGLFVLAYSPQLRSIRSLVWTFALRSMLVDFVRFDESLSYIANLMATETLSLPLASVSAEANVENSSLHAALSKSFVGEQRALSASSGVPFLASATRLFRASALRAELGFHQALATAKNGTVFFYKGLNFILTRGRSTLTFENFSYGQKRLLGALHYFSENNDIIVADELTNGLHHEWIDFLIKELGERQSFLTSQNPVLLDFLTFDSAADVSQRLIRCTMNDDGELHWCNIPTAEAEDFFITYSANMQQVGEIMRIQGLW